MLAAELAKMDAEARPYLFRVYGISEEEYDRLTTEDTKYELVDGVLIMHSPASIPHERLFGFLYFLMQGFVQERGLGEVLGSRATLHLATCRKVEPDLLFVSNANRHRLHRKEVEGTADLVVEILSQSTRDYDMDEKRRLYHEAGVGEIWFVDAERREVIVDRRQGDGYEESRSSTGWLQPAAIPGFRIDLFWLWQDPLPAPLSCLVSILG